MAYRYDKDEIKNNLDMEQIATLVSHFGGEPIIKDGHFIAKTICHNNFGEGSHKLYYYENTSLFRCYTTCGDIFDIFELIVKIKKQQEDVEIHLPQAMELVVNFFGLTGLTQQESDETEDWKILNNYTRIENINLETKQVELKTYDKNILRYFPHPRIIPWEEEGISNEVMRARSIAYNPKTGGILIPHFDINGNLIGIRERTLIKENEKRGKYLPSIINGTQYSHPLGFNLYGLDQSKENISAIKTAIVVEAEKSVLLYESYFGLDNSIICATCGSSLLNYQAELLMNLGVQEIVLGFDKDFIDNQDENFIKVINRLKNMDKKYGNYVQISFLFDKENLLNYKDSPLDRGKKVFQQLYKHRVRL